MLRHVDAFGPGGLGCFRRGCFSSECRDVWIRLDQQYFSSERQQFPGNKSDFPSSMTQYSCCSRHASPSRYMINFVIIIHIVFIQLKAMCLEDLTERYRHVAVNRLSHTRNARFPKQKCGSANPAPSPVAKTNQPSKIKTPAQIVYLTPILIPRS